MSLRSLFPCPSCQKRGSSYIQANAVISSPPLQFVCVCVYWLCNQSVCLYVSHTGVCVSVERLQGVQHTIHQSELAAEAHADPQRGQAIQGEHARITVQSVMSQSICSPPGLHVIQSAWNRSASCELTVYGVCSCSVWWGAVTPRLPLRAGWPVTSPLTSAHRVHPKCPIRAKSRRSLHPRPASTRGGNWRTNKDARYVCTNSHMPLCPDSFTLFHLRRKHILKKWRTDTFV